MTQTIEQIMNTETFNRYDLLKKAKSLFIKGLNIMNKEELIKQILKRVNITNKPHTGNEEISAKFHNDYIDKFCKITPKNLKKKEELLIKLINENEKYKIGDVVINTLGILKFRDSEPLNEYHFSCIIEKNGIRYPVPCGDLTNNQIMCAIYLKN